jgi:hypothetical protein
MATTNKSIHSWTLHNYRDMTYQRATARVIPALGYSPERPLERALATMGFVDLQNPISLRVLGGANLMRWEQAFLVCDRA